MLGAGAPEAVARGGATVGVNSNAPISVEPGGTVVLHELQRTSLFTLAI